MASVGPLCSGHEGRIARHLYVFVTDGQNVLVVDNGSTLSLPNYTHWPVVKKKPRDQWARALVRHVTYGLLEDHEALYERIPRPPHIDPAVALVRFTTQTLAETVCMCKRARRWFRHYGSGSVAWSLRLIPLVREAPLMDPCSMQAWTACLPGDMRSP